MGFEDPSRLESQEERYDEITRDAPRIDTLDSEVPTRSDRSKIMDCWDRFGKFFPARYFVMGMIFVIALAAIIPDVGKKGGPLKPEWTVKYGLVPLIFFISGLSLKSKQLIEAIVYFRLNALVQLFNLGFIPAVMYFLVQFLREATDIDRSLLNGLIVMACVPCTVSMCIILTTTAKGNEAAALFNATFGNLMGVFVTPALLLLLLGSESSVSFLKVIEKLTYTLLVPLFAGQILQQIAQPLIKPVKPYFGKINKIILLAIIFNTFCDTFARDIDVAPLSFVAIGGIVVVVYLLFFLVARIFFSLGVLHFSRRDQVAGWFCATQKTVAMGIPLINIIYEGNPNIGLISVPLLIYHPLQLIVGSTLLGSIQKWVVHGHDETSVGDEGEKGSLGKAHDDDDDDNREVSVSSHNIQLAGGSRLEIPANSRGDRYSVSHADDLPSKYDDNRGVGGSLDTDHALPPISRSTTHFSRSTSYRSPRKSRREFAQ